MLEFNQIKKRIEIGYLVWQKQFVLCNLTKPNFYSHGRSQNGFLGWANHALDRAKDFFCSFHPEILIQICYFVLKYHKCPVPGPGKYLVLPIGADAHFYSGYLQNNVTKSGKMQITRYSNLRVFQGSHTEISSNQLFKIVMYEDGSKHFIIISIGLLLHHDHHIVQEGSRCRGLMKLWRIR